jgi:N-acetylglucosaminyl-diphospho-decaprenol L-rhamnosyltransferase
VPVHWRYYVIAVSIISHGHGEMIKGLIRALLACPEIRQVIVTRNIPEVLEIAQDDRIVWVDNALPKGFGANHNAAFAFCTQPFFCPLNPDIALFANPFPELMKGLARSDIALIAPLVVSPFGGVEDSMRHFPTLRSLATKALGRGDGRYVVQAGQADFFAEWVAGMFMLFRSEDFARLKGFDERFFLYYEDVDICVRVWQQGLKVAACPRVSVVHHARRDSRRSLRYLRWHLASMGRYFLKYWGRLPRCT